MPELKHFLLWSTVGNYVVLIVWFAAFAGAREWMYRLHGRWFHLSREAFDAIHYSGMAFYKVLILVLNLVPLIVLSLGS